MLGVAAAHVARRRSGVAPGEQDRSGGERDQGPGADQRLLFLLPLHLQRVARLSPLASGARRPLVAAARGATAALDRPVVAGAGLTLMTRVGPDRPWPELPAAISLFGLGMAVTVAR